MSGNVRNSEAAGDAENVSAALLPQQRQSSTEHPDHSEIVRVEQVADLLVAGFLRGSEQADSGIVDKNVQPAEMRVCLLNHLVHLRGVGDVEGEGQRPRLRSVPRDRRRLPVCARSL